MLDTIREILDCTFGQAANLQDYQGIDEFFLYLCVTWLQPSFPTRKKILFLYPIFDLY